jgi:hypothetical protein
MSAFLDDSLVGVLLLISAAYAFSALGPRSLRRRAFNALSVWLARASAMGMGRVALYGEPLQRVAQRLARAAETKAPGACGGCDNCGAGQPGAGQPGAGQPDARTPGVEVKPKEVTVPIAHIGRARR